MKRATASAPRAATPGPRSDGSGEPRDGRAPSGWERPVFEVIPLDCEITAYAPAGDEPLF